MEFGAGWFEDKEWIEMMNVSSVEWIEFGWKCFRCVSSL